MFNRKCRGRNNAAFAEVNKRHLNVDYLKAQHQMLLTLQHIREANEANLKQANNRRLKNATSSNTGLRWLTIQSYSIYSEVWWTLMIIDGLVSFYAFFGLDWSTWQGLCPRRGWWADVSRLQGPQIEALRHCVSLRTCADNRTLQDGTFQDHVCNTAVKAQKSTEAFCIICIHKVS